MICKLPKCTEPVQEGKRAYCCDEHYKISALNKSIARKVQPGAEVYLCTTVGCHKVYLKENKEEKCHICRSGFNNICLRDGCEKPIPKDRTAAAVYCSKRCVQIHKLADRREKTRILGRKVITCGAKGCGVKFQKTSNAVKFCPSCRNSGKTYDSKTGTFFHKRRRPNLMAPGKFHCDFRTTICRRKGIVCRDYSRCSDSVILHKKGAFDYQLNGGVDCYKEPGGSVRLMGRDSMRICSTKYLP